MKFGFLAVVYLTATWSIPMACADMGYDDIAILYAYPADAHNKSIFFCIPYNHLYHELPRSDKDAVPHQLVDFTPEDGCSDIYQNGTVIAKAVVAVERGGCNFVDKAALVQKYKGIGILNVIQHNVSLFIPGNSNYDRINITVAIIKQDNFEKIKALGSNVVLLMFSPKPPLFDLNELIIFMLALISIIVGGHWSGISKYTKTLSGDSSRQAAGTSAATQQSNSAAGSFPVSVKILVLLVTVMCILMVGLYFFYSYLVYIVIALFCIASSVALYTCLYPIWNCVIPLKCRLKFTKGKYCRLNTEVKNVILMGCCFGVGLLWAIERHASYAWILQDFLGVTFCVHMIKMIQMPSLKACTIFLVLLFFYDVFFVFITPLFTKNGDSVMVDVATGRGTDEQSACFARESMLGFGDVIMPGILVAYNHGFDVKVNSSKIYFISSLIAYVVGLILAFLALALMKTGQPALLYLVPCTLLATFVISCIRGELKHMWKGDIILHHEREEERESRHVQQPEMEVDEFTSSAINHNEVVIDKEDEHLLHRDR